MAPAATPVTAPVELFTVAIEVFELDQVPPVNELVNVELAPTLVVVVPEMEGIKPATKFEVFPVLVKLVIDAVLYAEVDASVA